MRRARVAVAVTAFAAASLAGCADRPNDLGSYYDEPETTAQTPEPAPAATSSSSEPPSPPRADPAVLGAEADSAVLTDEDVASEGVLPAGAPQSAQGCLAEVPLELVAAERRDARWDYPTGSTLAQLVTVYADRPAADVLGTRVRCDGAELELPVAQDVDAHTAWCADGTCTALFASGNVLSGIQVSATDDARAQAAVQRLAPIAAAKLGS
ncbi:hypothetical protein [Prauserella cavernicola]|uniref:DUF3558 domain-containing protein n=1 Tax=Prauserella cavernicola TaxID=2800127 RepID=A0A934QPB7_9PSEU|nr:hypothetical protein [Prauserella cavernicola]MBK1782939.1 hypothetical protein [Prauserella cavernicola]